MKAGVAQPVELAPYLCQRNDFALSRVELLILHQFMDAGRLRRDSQDKPVFGGLADICFTCFASAFHDYLAVYGRRDQNGAK